MSRSPFFTNPKQHFRFGPAKSALREDVLWRSNLIRAADKLGAELSLGQAGRSKVAIVASVNEYVEARRKIANSLHGDGIELVTHGDGAFNTAMAPVFVLAAAAAKLGGGNQKMGRRAFLQMLGAAAGSSVVPGRAVVAGTMHHGSATSVSAITNSRTGTSYQFLPDAIWNAATGDTILIPAGTFAPAFPGTPYAHWKQLDSQALGYTASFNNMYMGPTTAPNGTMLADYISLVGVGTANNGHAVISRPVATLTADWNPGDTVLHLDSGIALFPPSDGPGGIGTWVWGQQTDPSYLGFTLVSANASFSYTGISGNTLTGVTNSAGVTIPAGTMVIMGPRNTQALFVADAPNPGHTFTNLELWGAVAGGNAPANPIRQYGNIAGGLDVGSITVNNCYFHDCSQGVGLGSPIAGTQTFVHIFGTELFRCGWPVQAPAQHNAYVQDHKEFIFDGSYSHFTMGAHLVKTRAYTNYITYSRITGERTDSNPADVESDNIDLAEGGLTYVIGCMFEQSLHAANSLLNYQSDGPGEGNLGAFDPNQELYCINNTCIGPANGTGNQTTSSYAPFQIQSLGVTNVECPLMGQTSGGSLAARTYIAVASGVDGSGNETAGSVIGGYEPDGSGQPVASVSITANNGQSTLLNSLAISANKLLTVQSPLARSGCVNWHAYANYADPVLYMHPTAASETGNQWFWDASFTQAIFSQAAGGSNPTTFLLVGFTYQYPTGESIRDCVRTAWQFNGLNGFNVGFCDGSYAPISQRIDHCAFYEVAANNVMSAASPPDPGNGATGWNIYTAITTFSGGGYTSTPLSKQNFSPIALGVAWTEPTSGFIESADVMPNLLRQNASAIAIGMNFTEPTTGLANHNPSASKLVWKRRGSANSFGATDNGYISEWWAHAPSPLTNYQIDLYALQANPMLEGQQITASVVAIKGAVSTTWPFSASLNSPTKTTSSPTVSFSEAHGVVVALFRKLGGSLGTAGSGYTQIYSNNLLNSEYQVVAGPQTNFAVTQTGGGASDICIADVVVVGAGGGVDGTATLTSSTNIRKASLTISTTQSDDILILQVTTDVPYAQIANVDQVGPPPTSLLVAGTPSGLVDNNLLGNYYPVPTGGLFNYAGGNGGVLPGGYITDGGHNTQVNTYSGSGSTFNPPLFSAVFADATPTDYDYRLKVGSVPIGAGADPGSSPEGQVLAPAYELKLFGLPTPGAPIPAKTARTNISWDTGAYLFGA